MNKKVIISKEDYDIYEFELPVFVTGKKLLKAIIFKRKRIRNWIMTHLEKVHPCFSVKCKTHLKFILEKKNIKVIAIVTSNFVIQKIKEKNKYCKLYISDPYNYRVFYSRPKEIISSVSIVFTGISFLCFVFGFSVEKINALSIQNRENLYSAFNTESEMDIDNEYKNKATKNIQNEIQENILSFDSIIANVVPDIQKNGGTITEVKIIAKDRICTLRINGMYPETIDKIIKENGINKFEVDSIIVEFKYENGIPLIVAEIPFFDNQKKSCEIKEKVLEQDVKQKITMIRNLLVNFESKPIEEKYAEPFFSCYIPIQKWQTVCKQLSELEKENCFNIMTASFSCNNDSKNIYMELSFSQNSTPNDSMLSDSLSADLLTPVGDLQTKSFLSDFGFFHEKLENIFIDKTSKAVIATTAQKKSYLSISSLSENSAQLVGKFYSPNGDEIKYYKTKDGSIQKETY